MIIKGDVNGDFLITIEDVVLATAFFENKLSPEDWQLVAADIDGDGVVTQQDVLRIGNHVRGIEIINEVV